MAKSTARSRILDVDTTSEEDAIKGIISRSRECKPDKRQVKPYFLSIENPVKGADFSHYEIQTVREYQQPGGPPFFEVVTDEEHCRDDCPEAIGPVLYGVYGRMRWGGASSITDFSDHEHAAELIRNITGITIPAIHE